MILSSPYKAIAALAMCLLLHRASAQETTDIKVKKPGPITHEFLYQGKPVSPLALVNLFPSDESEGKGKTSVDLKKYPYTNAVRHDSIYHSGWKKDYQQKRAYYMEIRYDEKLNDYRTDNMDNETTGGSVSYIVLGNTSGGKFIVLAYLSESGAYFRTSYVFILDIKDDKLIKLDGFSEPNWDRDNTFEPAVLIGSKVILWGSDIDSIPASAR